mmetsp:Transcript_2003/g.5432  ORF Transcript_2003/g.5432 Transcript_2003/m.5432 type:complete len:203 (-) Transcript_2003:1709-2317(-)
MSSPRDARSVATSTSMSPERNLDKLVSRSSCCKSPCNAPVSMFLSYNFSSRPFAWILELVKTSSRSCLSRLPSQSLRKSMSRSNLSSGATCRRVCVTVHAAPPTTPTPMKTCSKRYSWANFWQSSGKVAENMRVWRSSLDGMPNFSTTSRMKPSMFMESMRSASSSTRHCTSTTSTMPELTKSQRRPGVATHRSPPFASCSI